MDRLELVAELLNCARLVPDVLGGLAACGWDFDAPPCELMPMHIQHVLQRFVGNSFSAEQVEQWANAIECRDDIAYEPSSTVGMVLFELANPAVTQRLDLAGAQHLLELLSVDP